jgi:3',5'-cyclic-AMP phosphodiesterase
MSESSHESWMLNRRGYLKLATVGASTAPLSMLAGAANAAPDVAPRQRTLRFAHLTDIHVQPELNAAKGLTTCLRHVQSLQCQSALKPSHQSAH